MKAKSQATGNSAYHLLIIALSIMVLLLLAIEVSIPLSEDMQFILQFMDLCICMIFFGDFIFSIKRAENKIKYLFGWGLLDLLSCLPTIDLFRYFRLTRILRALRLIRGIKAAKAITDFVMMRNAGNAFLAAFLASVFIVSFSSVAILHVENAEISNIHNAEDAIWWSLATITTVGYGDKYPVTAEGRIIAAILMIWGLGIFGTFTGFVATWFQDSDEVEQLNEINELKTEVKRLREVIEQQAKNSF